MTAIVVMGVSAAGKTSVARELSSNLGATWADADHLHPASNVAKMAAGHALSDEDRWPWLDIVGERLVADSNIVVACSALRRVYRDRLRAARPDTLFLLLHAERSVLASRAASRKDHFMPPSLLDSQLATLETLDKDERGVIIDVEPPLHIVVSEATEWISQNA